MVRVAAQQVIWVPSLVKSLNFLYFFFLIRLIRHELWKNSIEVYEESPTSVKESFLIAIKF